MPKTPDLTSRLIILNKHPQKYIPIARDLLVSEPMTSQQALEIGKMAVAKHPLGIAGFAFIEGAKAPATVKLNCPTCTARKQTQTVDMLKLLLG